MRFYNVLLTSNSGLSYSLDEAQMIEKVLCLRGIGLLQDAIKTPVQLRRFNILFGGNGRGKSTLTAVLRSLASNAPLEIIKRRTIGGAIAPEAAFLIDGTSYTFTATAWDKPYKEMLIFDAEFVDRNVYSGREIDAEHRKNLHSFAIGEEGVKLAREVDRLAREISTANTELNNAQEAVLSKAPDRSIGIEEFLGLDLLDDADRVIAEQQKYVSALQEASAVALLPLPEELAVPGDLLVSELEGLLSATISDVSTAAEALVKHHIDNHAPSEGWIEEGVPLAEQECPFCGRDTDGVSLIAAYQQFFSQSYRDHKLRLQSRSEEITGRLSAERFAAIGNVLVRNLAQIEKWKPYLNVEFNDGELDVRRVSALATKLLKALRPVLQQKVATPLDPVLLSDECRNLIREYDEALASLAEYNARIATLRAALGAFKEDLSTGDLATAQRDLRELKNRKARHTDDLRKLCTAYKAAKKKKTDLTKKKDEAKTRLDSQTDSLLATYRDSINDYITKCGGNFTIADMTTAYPGGVARVEYKLKIFGEQIDLTSKKAGMIGFDTAMSQGDKNTLAFAFFLAKLKHSSDLSSKVVVFDDPLSSHDAGRRQFTRAQLINVAKQCNQLIILTHDDDTASRLAREARSIPKQLPESEQTFWEFRLVRTFTELHSLDVFSLAKLPYLRRWETLKDFLENGGTPDALPNVLQAIRPALEDNLKFRYPDEIPPQANLGTIIKLVREAKPPLCLVSLQRILPNLEQINSYVTADAHGDEIAGTTQQIDAAELRIHALTAIEVMRGTSASMSANKS